MRWTMENQTLIKNRNYLKFLSASSISKFGDAIDSIALSWMIYVMTGSKMLMGTIFAVSFIPNLIFTPLGGIRADKGSKKKQAILGDMGRAVSVCIMGLLFYYDQLEVWHIFLFTIINSTFESYSSPARGSLLPQMIDESQFMKASSLGSSVGTFSELIGLGVAGVIIANLGIAGAIFIDAATFLASGLIMSSMRLAKDFKAPATEKRGIQATIQETLTEMKEGFAYVHTKKLVLTLMVIAGFLNLSFVPFNVLRPVYVTEIMHMGAEGLSMTGIALTLGIIIGGLLFAKVGDKIREILALSIGFIAMGASYAMLGVVGWMGLKGQTILYIAVLFSFSFGFFLPFVQAPLQSVLLKSSDRDKLGRVIAVFTIIGLGAVPIGGMVVGFLGEWIPVETLFALMGGLTVVVGIIAGIALRKYWIEPAPQTVPE